MTAWPQVSYKALEVLDKNVCLPLAHLFGWYHESWLWIAIFHKPKGDCMNQILYHCDWILFLDEWHAHTFQALEVLDKRIHAKIPIEKHSSCCISSVTFYASMFFMCEKAIWRRIKTISVRNMEDLVDLASMLGFKMDPFRFTITHTSFMSRDVWDLVEKHVERRLAPWKR